MVAEAVESAEQGSNNEDGRIEPDGLSREDVIQGAQGPNDDSDEEALSDLDEEQFKEDLIPLTEEVYKLDAHRRGGAERSVANRPAEKRRQRRARPSFQNGEDRELEERSPKPRGGRSLSKNAVTGAQMDQIPPEEPDEDARELRELNERMDEALKTRKRKQRLTGDDLDRLQDEEIARLRSKMRNAAIQDSECVQNGQPALNKIRMLPEVSAVLSKPMLAESILDGNLLESVRIWLEPLPDASLPSYEIQRELFNALLRLPIKTIHLRESGLGRVVLFYQKSKRPHQQIKRAAEKLISEWTRPIMGRSDDYRDRRVMKADFKPDAILLAGRQSKHETLTPAEENAIRRNRAAIPVAKAVTYNIAPRSFIAPVPQQQTQRNSTENESALKRIRTRITSNRQQRGRKSNINLSIQGNSMS